MSLNFPRFASFLIFLLGAAVAPVGAQTSGFNSLFTLKTNLDQPNTPLVMDLFHDSVPELVLTDINGRLKVYNAINPGNRELVSGQFGNKPLTAPVAGDFSGTNTFDVAFGTETGDLIIVSGSTFRELARLKLSTSGSFGVIPSVVPITHKTADGTVVRDRLILIDTAGQIFAADYDAEKRIIKPAWPGPVSSGATLLSPMVGGNVRGRESLDLVGVTNDGMMVCVDAVKGSVERQNIVQRIRIVASPLLLDVNGDGRQEVILTLRTGEMRCLQYNVNEATKFRNLWTSTTASDPEGQPTLLMAGTDRSKMLIMQGTADGIFVVNAADGKLVRKETASGGVTTAPALIPRPKGLPEVALSVGGGLVLTSGLNTWLTNPKASLNFARTTSQIQIVGTAVVATRPENSEAILIGVGNDAGGLVHFFSTGLTVSEQEWPTRTPWQVLGGGMAHTGSLDREAARSERSRREAKAQVIAGWEAELKSAVDNSDWTLATEIVTRLVEHDPRNSEYASQSQSIAIRKNLLVILASLIAGLLLVGFTTLKTLQYVKFTSLRRRAEGAAAKGEFEEARRYYSLLHARYPKNAGVMTALGRVLVSLRDYSEETIVLYRKALAVSPADGDFLHSFARALMLEPKTTDEALQIYEKALQTFPEPQLLEYAIGRCLVVRNDLEEAGKRLRSALRGGVATEALYAALCDVYLHTKNFGAKSLPIFQQQFNSRSTEKEFLEGYLLSCIDAKKMDAQAESLCQSVLEYSPNFLPAYVHLAQILMQKNQIGAAIEEIRNATRLEPTNQLAVSMLAQCYLLQNRKDDEALQAYHQALELQRDEREILRTLSNIYAERGQFDTAAVQIYHRCIEQNPNDVPTLKALAQTALMTSDFALAVRSVESLLHVNQTTPRLLVQLATAYVRMNIQEPKAERVLREALRQEPANAEFIGALARVLTLQDRNEVEVIPNYEAHLDNFPNDVSIGRQLVKCYIKGNRYENALGLTQRLMALAPEDEELIRLNALASLYDNKLDAAVSEYQRILERNPNDREALVNLALAYGQKLRTDDEAALLFSRAMTIQPNNDLLHLATARVCAARSDAAAAVESYKMALKVRANNEENVMAAVGALLSERPELLRIRWFLVETLVQFNRLRDALDQLDFITQQHPGQGANVLKALESILSKDSNNINALVLRSTLLMASGQIPDAIKGLEKAHSLRANSPEVMEKLAQSYQKSLEKKDAPEVRVKLGKLYFSQQEFDHAIGCFQKTAQDYRWEAESTKMLGRCFGGKGMLDLALQEFKKLVVDPETKELLYDLAQRYEAKKDLVGAKTVYRQLFAADINYKDVKTRFEMLSGSTSDPMAFEKTSIVQQMSEEAARRYELLDELGRGAMGIVYRARDKELDEVVALKILPDNMSNNPEAVRRFKIEARNARKLSHPNIVRIHDIGEEMGRKYISMEYVDGSDLKRKIKTAPGGLLKKEEVIKYAMQCADALGYAHRIGVVHRDIKPANIMLTSRDDVKVTDFGIAKMMDGGGEGTMVGAVIGTPLYMSPEQVQGIPVDNRADVYAFGIMIYEMFNGRPPFTEGDLAYQHMHKEPARIEALDDRLWGIVAKCLAKKKEDRWNKAEDVYDALREYLKG